jgi:hypothetical protein
MLNVSLNPKYRPLNKLLISLGISHRISSKDHQVYFQQRPACRHFYQTPLILMIQSTSKQAQRYYCTVLLEGAC